MSRFISKTRRSRSGSILILQTQSKIITWEYFFKVLTIIKSIQNQQKYTKIDLRKSLAGSTIKLCKKNQSGFRISVAEFKEFKRRFKFKPRFKYGWFHLKLYQMFQDLNRRLI